MLQVANGGGLFPARNVVGGDFLQLVRLGLRAPDDPVVLDSVRVLDQVLKRDLPQGPCWRRYNHDGYGQKDDGSAFDGTGVGRSWPLLTGERGHFALASGDDPLPFITSMERFANEGGMLTEQLWDDADLPGGKMVKGQPTGASMPLCWSHAEYLALVRSRHDGVAFDRVEPAFQRYVVQKVKSRHEFWSFQHPLRRMPQRKILRLVTLVEADVVWTSNGWKDVQSTGMTQETTLGLWFADLSTAKAPAGARIEFTFFWKEARRWEGRNFETAVTP
jgi:glucoamylase